MSMQEKARRGSESGRAVRGGRSYRIPQEEFERGCRRLCAMWLAAWILMWSVETGLIPCPW